MPGADSMLRHTVTQPSMRASELDELAIRTGFRRRVRERCPDHEAFAMSLLERLPPDRWRLEWHLPWWLGEAFGLDDDVSRELVLSNVLGLASIRLDDDLADGEVTERDLDAARAVGAALFDAAIEPYRRRIPRDSTFWPAFVDVMAAWRSRGVERGSRTLVAAGAPLKVGAMATCVLAAREDALPALEALLDEVIESLVLDDHVADWEADVAAGRPNAFVHLAIGEPGPNPVATRRAVLVALLTTDALPRTFTRIVAGFQRAAGAARDLDNRLEPLAKALLVMADQARDRGAALAAHYRDLGDAAAKLLVPATDDRRS